MGMFMASVAFRRNGNWESVKPEIEAMYRGVTGLVSNLDQECDAYAIVSPYGDQGAALTQMAGPISRLTGDYAVMATCVDSDMNILELYRDGILIERCGMGIMFEEFCEMEDFTEPHLETWKPLLLEPAREAELRDALFGEEIFAEDQLRKLSVLTGLPIFDDALVFAE